MKTQVAITILISVLITGAYAQESEYEWRFGYQMGTRAPDEINMTEAASTADNGAVYANRNVPEFAIVAWNFEPSTNPLRFKEDTRKLRGADLVHLGSTHTDGYIVVKDGVIIHEYYAQGMHQTTKHAVYSVGKSWTSAVWHDVLLKAMKKKVGEILPELKGSVYGPQTVRNVVDMRTSVYWYEDYDDPESPVVISGSATGWDFKSIETDQISFLKTLKKNPKLKEGDWYYVSADTMLMGLLGSKLKGKHPYEGLRQFYDALGLEHISGTIANLHGQYSAEGGQYFTLRDFVKLPYAMANGGMINEKTVITGAYFDDVFSADEKKKAAWKKGPYAEVMPEVSFYSNQWYVVDDNIAFGIGSYGQFNIFNRKTKVAIAKFSTYPTGQGFEMFAKDIPWLIEQAKAF